MRTKLFCLFVPALALTIATDASSGDGGPTLTVHTKANGMVVDAIRHYAGQSQRDTTGLIPEATSLGPQMFKLRFKECGEVKFSDQESGNVGFASGRGTTSKCQITNWDVQWKVVHVRR